MIANYATFDFDKGGDLSFKDPDAAGPVFLRAKGDTEGKPRNQTGWWKIFYENHGKYFIKKIRNIS